MLAIGVDFGGVGLTDAIKRGRAAAMPKIAKWIADKVRSNIGAQRDPWGRGWRPKSRNSDGGAGPALASMAARVREESTAETWNVIIDDPHASAHNFGRAKKSRHRGAGGAARRAARAVRMNASLLRTARRRGARGETIGFFEGETAGLAAAAAVAHGRTATSGEPTRAMLPLRVRNSGRQEPLVDFPIEWTREIDRILDAEIQREIDALRAPAQRAA